MTLKYESEILFDLMKRDGDDTPSDVLPYESELKEKYLKQVEGAYPKLMDYRSEWLNYNLNGDLPADFPMETLSNVTVATVDNVVPYEYGSAILKGKTDENLQSVKMPVLTTVGKNLFDKTKIIFDKLIDWNTGNISDDSTTNITDFIKVIPNTQYTMSFNFETSAWTRAFALTEPKHGKYVTDANGITDKCYFDSNSKIITFTTSPTTKYLIFSFGKGVEESFQLEQGSTATSYEPYKSNILTVNEDVTLHSNGNVYDELDLLTGKLTQRIDEDGSVLTQEVVKTVDLSCINEQGESVTFRPIEGTMHVSTSSQTIPPLLDMSVPVEATSQNLMSFANIVEEE